MHVLAKKKSRWQKGRGDHQCNNLQWSWTDYFFLISSPRICYFG